MQLTEIFASLLFFFILVSCTNKDTSYDPDFNKGETLFDQRPNPEGEAERVCAGHLPPEKRKPWQTGRC